MKKGLWIIIILVCSCKSKSTDLLQYSFFGEALGTTYSLQYQNTKSVLKQSEIDSVFAVVNQSLSTYIPTSDISKINNGDTTVVVDHMFKDVFVLSKEIYAKTDRVFDPTVGVLVNAWGFGPEKGIKMDSTRVDSLLQYVGFNKVNFTANNTISKLHKNIRFDFNAIAKGYTIDRLAVLLNDKLVDNYLLEVGGELVAKGENKLRNRPWGVSIDDPQMGEDRTQSKAVKLVNKAMASSGNYRHFRIDSLTGAKYVHSVNPITGYAKNSSTLAATVLASTCAVADAYATALMVFDVEAAKQLAVTLPEIEAYIIYLDDNDEVKEFMTDGFKKVVISE